jgi:hypothetical protein
MRSIVTLITAAAFVLHFLWGCCAHHVHADGGAACLIHVEARIHSHDGGGHESHDPSGQSSNDSGSPCPSEHSSDCHCVFMAAVKSTVAKTVFTAVVLPSLPEVTLLGSTSSLSGVAIDSGGLFKLPVRIHLYYQIFLI